MIEAQTELSYEQHRDKMDGEQVTIGIPWDGHGKCFVTFLSYLSLPNTYTYRFNSILFHIITTTYRQTHNICHATMIGRATHRDRFLLVVGRMPLKHSLLRYLGIYRSLSDLDPRRPWTRRTGIKKLYLY